MKKILTITLLIIFAAAAAAAVLAQEKQCGSLEKFNQTKRWEDLPGCLIEDESESKPISADEKFSAILNSNTKNFLKAGKEASALRIY